ncbi:MAG TPA: hypothetical protein VFM14_03740, partial [Gemmatimonadales bacterium]|nr:hypothetical protein [Gemmatimonadales bacterium]
MTRHHFAAAGLALLAVAGCRDDTQERVTGAIRGAATSKQAPDYVARGRWKLVRGVYRDHAYAPLWTHGKQSQPRCREVMSRHGTMIARTPV